MVLRVERALYIYSPHLQFLTSIDCKKHGRSVRDFTRRFLKNFLKLKLVGDRIIRHSRIIETGQKGGTWVELVAETTPTKRDSGDSCGNPPVTQVATPLIMQNFKV